ncbi:MAG TPA: hypothetical protein VE136_16175 [Anaerolineales bacterium]|jgi:hypothetical protein|nr:hypothetical protein [Anaerolineales bacterium]
MEPLVHASGILARLRFAMAAVAGFDQAMRSKTTVQTRDEIERIVMFATASELMGFSMVPPGLISRLLPYFVPRAYQWKRISQGWTDFSGEIKGGC